MRTLLAASGFARAFAVLPGEDFGRGHQRRLLAVGDGQQHGVHGDDRLAAADVALQQAVHRDAVAAMSAAISSIACRWPAVSSNGNSRRMRASILALVGSGGRGALVLQPPFADRQGELQDEQLLIDEPPPGLFQAGLVGGEMDLRQRGFDRPEVVGVEKVVGKHFVDQRAHAISTTPCTIRRICVWLIPSVSE